MKGSTEILVLENDDYSAIQIFVIQLFLALAVFFLKLDRHCYGRG